MLVLGTKIYKIKTGTLLQRKKNCESKGKVPKHSEDRRRGADSVNTHTGKSVIAITHSNNGLTLSLEIRQFTSVLSPDSKDVFLRHHFLYVCHFLSLQKLFLVDRSQLCYIRKDSRGLL